MKPNIAARLDRLGERLHEVDQLLSTEEATRDMAVFCQLGRERAELEPVVTLYQAYRRAETDIKTAREMAQDPEMLEFAEAEIEQGQQRLAELDRELELQLLPKDSNDERNVILEVRAGTGGDEAALFAGDLFRMYLRFAERRRWQVEIISESPGEMGGYKEVIARIIGQGAYSVLKFESGAHRVQRVPATETQGRIHTSACTVAILPEADDMEEVVLNPAELRIDTFRASGAGGQHINKTDSAVRITHLPTNIVVTSSVKSQHQNRANCMAALRARLYQLELDKRNAAITAQHDAKGEAGWGNQIRSYVLQPYQMVKDLRTGVETSDTQGVLDGDLDRFMAATLAMNVAGKSRAEAQAEN